MIKERIKKLPLGYSKIIYQQRKYGLTRTDFNHGKSIKLYAEGLGGNDVVSLNYYITSKEETLKPCEMSEQKVIHFLNNMQVI